MIEGRFVKDGEITEVILPNGLTQLIVDEPEEKEIQAFTFMPRKIEKKRTWLAELKDVLILISLTFPIVPTVAILFGLDFNLYISLLCATCAWDGIVMYANKPLQKNK